jgi:hypothetical protein
MKNCYIVTSAIEVDNSHHIKDNQIRSLLSTEERLADTNITISSILERDPTATIFLVDISNTDFSILQKTHSTVKYIHLASEQPELAQLCRTHPSKSWGESMILSTFLAKYKNHVIENYDFLVKVSGRYYFSNDFTVDLCSDKVDKFLFKYPVRWDRAGLHYLSEKFLPSDMYVNDKLSGYYTVAYAVGKDRLNLYETVLYACTQMCDRFSKYFYVDVEFLLYKIIHDLGLHKHVVEVDWTIQGRGGQNGKYFKM